MADLPGWVVPVASILVALIGALALIIVRRTRGPVEIPALWEENRKLRADLTELSQRVDGLIASREDQLTVNRIMGEGFDALSNGVERMSVQPTFTPPESEAISRARALRDDTDLWHTLQNPRKKRSTTT